MKISAILILTFLFTAQANNSYSQGAKVSMDMKNVTIESVIDKIESKTKFKFFFHTDVVDLKRKISIKVDKKKVVDVLNMLFSKTETSFEIDNRKILLFKRKISELRKTDAPIVEKIQQMVKGVITDENNVPLPGANIVEKGTSNGATTDFDGNFTIDVASGDAILVVTFIGYASKEVPVANQTEINIQLLSDADKLGEVIITALGIKKEARAIGYATSSVKSEEMSVNRSTNFMNSLQGKVSGVNISGLGTGPGGSSKIRIRGQSSISGQNNPLIVINGVPIDNTNFGTNPGNSSSDSSQGVSDVGITSDGGDGFSSINPDDIESMTVLKGAAAAALYGSRAKDGVIMITTKTGSTGNGIGITYNMSATSHSVLDYTDFQYEYGQGENGVRPTSANPTSGQWSFGEKIEPGMTHILYDGIEVPYVAQRNRVKDFYRNGTDITHSIGLSGGSEKGGFNLSFSNLSSDGITPNNKFERTTVSLGLNYNFSEKLSLGTNVNYSNEKNTNPPNIGMQDNTIPVSLFNLANTLPLNILDENKYNADGNEYVYSRFRNRTNPYWVLAEQFNNIKRDRIFGNISLKYNIKPWLYVQGRIGQDYYSRDQDYNALPTGQASLPPAPSGFFNGTYTQEVRRFRERNIDVLISGNNTFSNIDIDYTLGGNQMERRSDVNRVSTRDFVIRDLYTVQNARVKNPQYSLSERGVNSLFASVGVAFNKTLYLNGTVRNDWFSTLSPENRSVLYPSVSASYLFSQSFENKPSWLNYGKLRAAYGEVGSDTDVAPYSDVLFYNINPNQFGNSNGEFQPVGGATTGVLPNPDLRPMRTSEVEFGLDLKMFDNRVGLDVSVYRKTTSDQIVSAQVSDASGFSSKLINSGESRSDGIEWLLSLAPIKTDDFKWNFSFNGSLNKTKVLSLLTDKPGDRILVGNHVFNGFLFQVVGEEIGQLGGFGFKRDSQGNQVFGDNGVPLRSDDILIYGSSLPNFTGGFTNSFNYKGFQLSFLIDFKLGGKMMSGTNFNAIRHGHHKITLPGRDGGVVGVGVNLAGQPNTVAAESQQYWEVVRSQQIVEPVIYNSGFWKLRQLSFGYDLAKFLPETSQIKSLKLNLVANNVLLLKKWVDNIDPDSFGFSSDNVSGLESTGVPTTRSIGFNLNCKF